MTDRFDEFIIGQSEQFDTTKTTNICIKTAINIHLYKTNYRCPIVNPIILTIVY